MKATSSGQESQLSEGTIDFDLGRLARAAAGRPPEGIGAAEQRDFRPTPIERQVVEALKILPKSDGQHEIRMRLNPPELGEVHVRLVVTETTASVFLGTQTEVAREAIQAALPQLRDVLQQSRLTPSTLEVSLSQSRTNTDTAGAHNGQRSPREQSQPDQRPAWAPSVGAEQAEQTRRARSASISQIDLLA